MLKFTLVALAILLFVFVLAQFVIGGGDRVSGHEARELVEGGAVLIDVRTPQEFAAGHIEGAKNIPVQELEQRLDDVGARDGSVVVYCRSGARSKRAARILEGAGFTDVYDLGPKTAW
jgi:rhodanese-related sulfurtransferase